jgi:hypothetical protein
MSPRRAVLLLIPILLLGIAETRAQQPAADLQIEGEASPTIIYTGTEVEVVMRVRNNGPDPSVGVRTSLIFGTYYVVSYAAPDGWVCSGVSGFSCTKEVVAAGEESVITAKITAPHTAIESGRPIRPVLWVFTSLTRDPSTSNNSFNLPVAVREHPNRSDLHLRFPARTPLIREGAAESVKLVVMNDGPHDAPGAIVVFHHEERAGFRIDATGGEWSCTPREGTVVCKRGVLVTGASSELDLQIVAPDYESYVNVTARLFGLELVDPAPANWAELRVHSGAAENFEWVMIPVAGDYRSPWLVEHRLMVDETIEVYPRAIGGCNGPCIANPFLPGLPIDPTWDVIPHSYGLPASLIYTRKGDSEKVHVSTRVRHGSQRTDSWGTEVPTIRPHELKKGRLVLLDVPLDPAFRTTLRIYDPTARDWMGVRVRVFGRSDAHPDVQILADIERAFIHSDRQITPALLPLHPGYIEIDRLTDPIQDGTGRRVWIIVESIDPELDFWAFASVTSNTTQHVTLVTPQ